MVFVGQFDPRKEEDGLLSEKGEEEGKGASETRNTGSSEKDKG
jgi:hypothetical protein